LTADIRFFWARLNANYWFYPALFSLVAAALAFAMVAVDRGGFAEFLNDVDWIVPARPQGAANMLTVMAGSMIGVASTVFSITIAAVAYASGNYGPRLLTNFMEDRGNQLSLATFIGSFVYAIIVLRAVRAEDETAATGADAAATALPGFTPQLSLLVAYILMGLCVAVLVFFLNHIPSSIRINKVLKGIGERLLEAIRDTYPVEDRFSDAVEPAGGEPITAWGTGYVQLIDFEELRLHLFASRAHGRFRAPRCAFHGHQGLRTRMYRGSRARLLHTRFDTHARAGPTVSYRRTGRDRSARLVARHQRPLHGDHRAPLAGRRDGGNRPTRFAQGYLRRR
jgi:uncharacterized membrane protein